MTGGRLNLGRLVAPSAGSSRGPARSCSTPRKATTLFGNWSIQPDPAAAGGARLQSTNLGAAKVTTALAAPGQLRRADVHGRRGPRLSPLDPRARRGQQLGERFGPRPVRPGRDRERHSRLSHRHHGQRRGEPRGLQSAAACPAGDGRTTATAAACRVRRCTSRTTGPQRIRIQIREDGIAIDQIVLSSSRFVSSAPGSVKNDATILDASTPAGTSTDAYAEVVLLRGGSRAHRRELDQNRRRRPPPAAPGSRTRTRGRRS